MFSKVIGPVSSACICGILGSFIQTSWSWKSVDVVSGKSSQVYLVSEGVSVLTISFPVGPQMTMASISLTEFRASFRICFMVSMLV